MSETLTKQLNKILTLYGNEIAEAVDGEITTIAKEAVKELKATSPKRQKNGGAYAKSWTSQKEKSGMYKSRAVVFNKKHYRLTHLLEKGHATRSGGRTKAMPHIKTVEGKIIKELPQRIEKKIKGGL